MDHSKIIESIGNTGFVLEYKVSQLLEENGWSIINSRYYLDDDSKKSREIDIIAYKAQEINETTYYTTLIISCKKSNEQIWTFLVKDLENNDPNIEKYPITDWSNNPIINFMKEKEIFKEQLVMDIKKNSDIEFAYDVKEQVFGFQQMNKKNYKLQNDKDIYNSIITSIKALEYERNALNSRINRDAVYNFNILSVFEGQMYSLRYNDELKARVQEISEIKYLNRHIINKNESFFRVHFINYSSLKSYIKHYDSLHDWHVEAYSNLKEKYRKMINESKDVSALNVLLEEFQERLRWDLVNPKTGDLLEIQSLNFNDDALEINCYIEEGTHENTEELIEYLNESEEVSIKIKKTLEDLYGYIGTFSFCNYNLPF